MCNDLISVIIPVYNTRKYLEKCINSVLNQKYQNLEIILVDDGSTDGSGILCDEFSKLDSRVKVIHKSNEGQSVARNVALDTAQGEYIAFVDSDDEILPDMFYEMLRNMIENNCDIAICGVNFLSVSGRCFKRASSENTEVWSKELLIGKFFGGHVFTGMCNKLYHKNAFKDIRFPATRCREDAYILHEVLENCNRAIVLPECYYIQNIRPGSTEQKGFDIHKLEVTKQIIARQKQFVKEKYPQYEELVTLSLANELSIFLTEIVVRNKLKYTDEMYKIITDLLSTEIKSIDVTKVPKNQSKKYNSLKFAAKHPKMNYCKNVYLRDIEFIKNIIKTIIIKIKG